VVAMGIGGVTLLTGLFKIHRMPAKST